MSVFFFRIQVVAIQDLQFVILDETGADVTQTVADGRVYEILEEQIASFGGTLQSVVGPNGEIIIVNRVRF